MKISLILLLFISFIPTTLFANDVYVIVLQKQEQKKQRGWSLADWMLTKNKMKAMDMWLALHTSANLFEFYLGAHQKKYDLEDLNTSTTKDHEALGGELGAYISILGLELEYDKSNEKYDLRKGMLALRLFGTSYQGTNLTIGGGSRVWDLKSDKKYSNYFLHGKAALNLLPFLGVQGHYQYYLPQKSSGVEMRGYLASYGAYLDIYFLRIYGDIFKEKINFSNSTLYTTQKRNGYTFGLQLFF